VTYRQGSRRSHFIAAISLIAGLQVLIPAIAQATPLGYQFDGLAFYQFNDPADLSPLALYHAGPDTSFFRITNNGASVFTGNIGEVAVNADTSVTRSFTVPATLNPGDSIVLSTSEESSNFGGWNGPNTDINNPQPGIQILMNGTVSLGANTEPVALSIFDRDIHSGVFQTNPFNVTLDNYILQGGDPIGRDTGDTFETSQAPGPFQFFERGVPEPSSFVLLVIGATFVFAVSVKYQTLH
jgi:hypothetical protein